MRLIDISPVLHAGMPHWPGDTPFMTSRVAEIAAGSVVNVSQVVTSVHIGAHADAPNHFVAGAADVSELPLEVFIGPCVVADARGARGPLITAEDVMPQVPDHAQRVLIRQYERYPSAWDPDLKGLAPDLIAALARRGVRLIGVDAASVDPANSKTLDAHHDIARHGIHILEGLLLDDVAAGNYELIALPLKIAGADASPVRAVLRLS